MVLITALLAHQICGLLGQSGINDRRAKWLAWGTKGPRVSKKRNPHDANDEQRSGISGYSWLEEA